MKKHSIVVLLAGSLLSFACAAPEPSARPGGQVLSAAPTCPCPSCPPADCAAKQGQAGTRIPLIGEDAPAFRAQTTRGPIAFPDDYKGRWVILFSHPADFTPVCTTEFMTFATLAPQFAALDCDLVGLSIDSNFSHIAWLRTIAERATFRDMQHVNVTFPLIADVKMDVARKYGMVQPSASSTEAVRAVFFIDPKAKIRAVIYYPLANGRNFQEIKRLLIAMQTSDAHKVATPADWQPGEDVIVPPPNSCGTARQRVEQPQAGDTVVDWFMTFRKLPKEKLKLP
ncbi:MAG: putative peroxiredoxin [Planctomycetes bacterium ADurb.Bin126]|nr:MAG: putative peroxiredoxin [Planctomycetes bacterium ADurb.Bin126]HOD83802.1 peroxiredoxin [Phycisphaerae bacterium]HQL73988.1 peroxiredoxin [Phycisphaerae bacterium]